MEISIPFWLQQLNIEVWKFSGVTGAKPLQEQIADCGGDLSWIELKIDFHTSP